MNRTIVIIVIGVALGGMVAGGIMVWAYMTQRSDAAIATPVVGDEPEPPPEPRPLVEVDSNELALDGFVLGMAEKKIAKVGRPLRLRFQKKVHDGGHVEYSAVPKRSKTYNSVRLLVAEGQVVGVRVKYDEQRSETYEQWKALLGEPYFTDDRERHWETVQLKAKARRDASKFYVALKEYRGRFPW